MLKFALVFSRLQPVYVKGWQGLLEQQVVAALL
jgi:hypothetical protein